MPNTVELYREHSKEITLQANAVESLSIITHQTGLADAKQKATVALRWFIKDTLILIHSNSPDLTQTTMLREPRT